MAALMLIWAPITVVNAVSEERRINTEAAALTYDVNPDGTATITGHNKYNNGVITVPAVLDGFTVKEIGARAFSHSNARTIVLPDTVTTIGASAFLFADAGTIELPPSLREIGASAFSNCDNLTSLVIPPSVTHIPERMCSDDTSLRSISLPDTITVIGSFAFDRCSSLTQAYLPSSLRTIGAAAFQDCIALTSVSVPGTVAVISQSAFEGCTSLETLVMEEGVREIDTMAFDSCGALRDVYLPSTLRRVAIYAFSAAWDMRVTYNGSRDEWSRIDIRDTGNEPLTEAPKTFAVPDPVPAPTATLEPEPTPTATPKPEPTPVPSPVQTVEQTPTPVPTPSMDSSTPIPSVTAAPTEQLSAELPELLANSSLSIQDTMIGAALIGLKATSEGTTLEELMQQFDMPSGSSLQVFAADGTLNDDTAVLGTGDHLVRAAEDGQENESVIIVQGDVIGSGTMSLTQLVRLAQAFTGKEPLEGPYLLAGDIGGDGLITLSDLVAEAEMMARMS